MPRRPPSRRALTEVLDNGRHRSTMYSDWQISFFIEWGKLRFFHLEIILEAQSESGLYY